MASCPKCHDVLINERQCDCGWRAPGALGTDLQRPCHEIGCRDEGSVSFGGVWFCSAHFQQQREGKWVADKSVAKHWMGEIRKRIANAKGPMAKPMREALGVPESSDLVQTEPGELG